MDSQKQQASERVKQANNILVTVSSNPSVDQLAACIGLTLALNKMGKHATAVFSGKVPSTLKFLQPEKTIEKNTDSLRDFIIALDKSKADKLRYKVEDRVVKIFITPYRTSIDDKDLEFSQGDFNVDVVLALGVHAQADLDQAITSHGRILHDATIVTVNIQPGGELGSINWLEPNASSLSELGVQLVNSLDKKLVDGQIATAFLTGIVAETDRFSNSKTSPSTMSISSELMASGANQQLVATKLEEPEVPAAAQTPIASQGAPTETGDETPAEPPKPDDGTLEIAHSDEPAVSAPTEAATEGAEEPATPEPPQPAPEPAPEKEPLQPAPQIHIDEHGELEPVGLDQYGLPPAKPTEPPVISRHDEPPKMVLQPPTMGGPMSATGSSDVYGGYGGADEEPGLPGMSARESSMPSSMNETSPAVGPTITPPSGASEPQNAPGTTFLGDQPVAPAEEPESKKSTKLPDPNETLTDIERDVHSSHLNPVPPAPTDQQTSNPFAPSLNDTMLPPVSGSNLNPPAAQADEPQTVSDVPVVDTSKENTTKDEAGPTVDNARSAVTQAIDNAASPPLEPIKALNAQPLGAPLAAPVQPWTPPSEPAPAVSSSDNTDSNAPPPVPPPMMPPTASS